MENVFNDAAAHLESPWEDIVRDYLEMACFMTEREQRFLIQFLKSHKIEAHEIDVHPAFSIDRHLVIIMEKMDQKECWLYHPQERIIKK